MIFLSSHSAARLREIVNAHHALVWRSLRRFGVPATLVDEAVSRTFDVLQRRIDDVLVGRERSFLVQVCARMASDFRRAEGRRRRLESEAFGDDPPHAPSPEDLLERREARGILDRVLDGIDVDARTVFVLHEMEQLTLAEIAESLRIPEGTAKSRFKKGREQFERVAGELRRSLHER